MNTDIKTVGIVGLGLIGGSMAKAVSEHTGAAVFGFDINNEVMNMAVMSGSIKGTLTKKKIRECDLIMVALTPQRLINWVRENAKYFSKDTILCDLCGIKRVVMNELIPISKEYGFPYVGGHPMAGKEVSGFANAESSLFNGASMILVPQKETDINCLDALKSFFLRIGFGTVVFTTMDEHDRIISYTSQLAHITSSAYIKSPTSQKHMGFSAGSYKDMTRVARLDPAMWTELFLDNRDNLCAELHELIKNLTDYLDALEADDEKRLYSLLEDGLIKKLNDKDGCE